MRKQNIAVFTFVCCVFAASSWARTWRVERDGSGDFTTIQPAVDAASPGDTIEIGPGRFNEWVFVNGNPHWPTIVHVTKNLVFAGSGLSETIIGPTDVSEFTWNDVVCGFRSVDDVNIVMRDLTVENIKTGAVYLQRGRLEIDDCEFRYCAQYGIYANAANGGWIRNSQFHDMGFQAVSPDCAISLGPPSNGVEIVDCNFIHNADRAIGCFWSDTRNIRIVNCSIVGASAGIIFADGASGQISNCIIQQPELWGIYLSSVGDVEISDTQIEATSEYGVGIGALSSASRLDIHNTVVSSNYIVLIVWARIAAGEIAQNHFLRTSDTAWWWYLNYYPLSQPRTINLENNYWGTTDTALLDQWIYDGNDSADVGIFVDYLPLADGPVQTEQTTWGAVKALFE